MAESKEHLSVELWITIGVLRSQIHIIHILLNVATIPISIEQRQHLEADLAEVTKMLYEITNAE